MKKKTILSMMLVLAILITAIVIPTYADDDTFQLSGKVVLPGNDTAPEGGMQIILEYVTDNGTERTSDDKVTTIYLQLYGGSRESYFSVNLKKPRAGEKYALSYRILSDSNYLDQGYYSVNGMQYYKAAQSWFDANTIIRNLVITPIGASKISGIVALSEYSVTQGAISVDVVAKTSGILRGTEDDFTAKKTVTLTNASAAYELKVPTTPANAGYTVMYETQNQAYVSRGWYSTTGTVLTEASASKVDVSVANPSNINLVLSKKANPTHFKLEGKVILPGNDTAPADGLTVTLHYRSDKGTPSNSADDVITNISVALAQGMHEAPFSVDIPYTASGAKYTLSYSLPSTNSFNAYWDKGYYTVNGMLYYNDAQKFAEGTVPSNLVITPVRAAVISGVVNLPTYTANQTVKVNVKAKTTGSQPANIDDYETETTVSLTNAAVGYSLRVPVTASNAGYIVSYSTTHNNYEKDGYYTPTGTTTKAPEAAKVDVSAGNRAGINLSLVAKKAPTPPEKDYDLNKDGKIDVKDMVLIAKAMGAKHKYDSKLDLNKDGVINVNDLKLIKAKLEKNIKKDQLKNFDKQLEKELKKLLGKDWEKLLGKDWVKLHGKEWEKYLERDWRKYLIDDRKTVKKDNKNSKYKKCKH